PAGKAKRATEANMKEFEARRAELEAKQAEILADARARQEKLDGQTVTVAQKAGVDGRLFGSVTNADIAAAIVAAGIEAVKANVRLPNGPLKAVGEYEVEVALHTDAVAKITVAVIAAAE
ncbi:50S ribosomal protein L9, partial [Neisseria gonorrhoeae]